MRDFPVCLKELEGVYFIQTLFTMTHIKGIYLFKLDDGVL